LDVTNQQLVGNDCSNLLHEIFGEDGEGWPAPSIRDLAQLPFGTELKVEAAFDRTAHSR
jgi:hypothetical protein